MIRWSLPLVFVVMLLQGCGSDVAEVSGTVLIDDQPLKEGNIIFEEVDQSKTPMATPIVDGTYALKMPAGNKKVKITASRPTSKIDPVMGTAAREPLIGPEYNDKTQFTVELKPGVNSDVNFKVRALPPGK